MTLGQYLEGEPMFNWYECGGCKTRWRVEGSINKGCPNKECKEEYNYTSWIAGADGESWDQKNADRLGMVPWAFEEKYGGEK